MKTAYSIGDTIRSKSERYGEHSCFKVGSIEIMSENEIYYYDKEGERSLDEEDVIKIITEKK